jgi:hypothetical protein
MKLTSSKPTSSLTKQLGYRQTLFWNIYTNQAKKLIKINSKISWVLNLKFKKLAYI